MEKIRKTKPARDVQPKKWALMGTIAATGLATALTPSGGKTPGTEVSPLTLAAYASESGEAGEGAIATHNAEVAFLVHLGFFEATHRIVAELYANGQTDLAQEHLESSHHAYYEDIAEGLTTYGATGFQDLSERFAEAVMSGASQQEVAGLAQAVLDAIAAVHTEAQTDARDEFKAIHLIVVTAAGDFQAGVEAGEVVLA